MPKKVMHRRLCEHEAGHCAAALMGGLEVTEARADFHDVRVEPEDPDAAAGYVLIPAEGIEHDPGRARAHAVAILAGPMCEGSVHWPPPWPLSLVPDTSDERQLGRLVEMLGLDRKGYDMLVHDAFELTTSREFDRLHMAIGELLEQGHALDGHTLRRVKAVATGTGTEHLTLKATTTIVDQELGQIEALASAWMPTARRT